MNAIMRKIDLDSPEVWQSRVNLATCFRAAARLGLNERVCNHLSSLEVAGFVETAFRFR